MRENFVPYGLDGVGEEMIVGHDRKIYWKPRNIPGLDDGRRKGNSSKKSKKNIT